MADWYYAQQGKQLGPVSEADLRQMAAAGQLQPTDMVWSDGMPSWAPASTVKGLFDARPAKAAPARVMEESIPMEPAGRPVKSAGTGGGITDWHPVLVYLVTIFTCGIFGIVYVLVVCSQFTEVTAGRKADSKGRPLGKPRHPVGVAFLSFITLGLYQVYWTYKVMEECSDFTNRRDFNPKVELSLMLIFWPYAIYVLLFKLPNMITAVQSEAGVPAMDAIVRFAAAFLNPFAMFFTPMLTMVYQDALNQVWVTVK